MTYLRVLQLAAKQLECDVANALEILLETGKKWHETDVVALLAVEAVTVPTMVQPTVDLSDYDQLLMEGGA